MLKKVSAIFMVATLICMLFASVPTFGLTLGENLVKNGGFDSTKSEGTLLEYWTLNGNAVYAAENNYVKLVGGSRRLSQEISVSETCVTYEVSLDALSADTLSPRVDVTFLTDAGSTDGALQSIANAAKSASNAEEHFMHTSSSVYSAAGWDVEPGEGWKRASYGFVVPKHTKAVKLDIYVKGGTDGVDSGCAVDNIVVRRNDTAKVLQHSYLSTAHGMNYLTIEAAPDGENAAKYVPGSGTGAKDLTVLQIGVDYVLELDVYAEAETAGQYGIPFYMDSPKPTYLLGPSNPAYTAENTKREHSAYVAGGKCDLRTTLIPSGSWQHIVAHFRPEDAEAGELLRMMLTYRKGSAGYADAYYFRNLVIYREDNAVTLTSSTGEALDRLPAEGSVTAAYRVVPRADGSDEEATAILCTYGKNEKGNRLLLDMKLVQITASGKAAGDTLTITPAAETTELQAFLWTNGLQPLAAASLEKGN